MGSITDTGCATARLIPNPESQSFSPQVIDFCREKGVDFVVVGPEQPLVEGLVDALAQADITAFGPTAAAAQLEGSKAFMKVRGAIASK